MKVVIEIHQILGLSILNRHISPTPNELIITQQQQEQLKNKKSRVWNEIGGTEVDKVGGGKNSQKKLS